MKALIHPQHDNRICEVSLNDFPVAEPLIWLDCPDQVTTQWSFNGSNFIEPTAPTGNQEYTYDQKVALVRVERDKRLAASDWTQLTDVLALHDSNWISLWNKYRQDLRDMMGGVTPDNINNVSYPTPPQ